MISRDLEGISRYIETVCARCERDDLLSVSMTHENGVYSVLVVLRAGVEIADPERPAPQQVSLEADHLNRLASGER